MRPAGEVVRAAQGLAICRADDRSHPEIGAQLVDADLEPAGTVVDVFGPVERPYLALSPGSGSRAASLVGSRLYVRTE